MSVRTTVFCDVYYCKFNKVLKTGARKCSRVYLHIGGKEESCTDFETKSRR